MAKPSKSNLRLLQTQYWTPYYIQLDDNIVTCAQKSTFQKVR